MVTKRYELFVLCFCSLQRLRSNLISDSPSLFQKYPPQFDLPSGLRFYNIDNRADDLGNGHRNNYFQKETTVIGIFKKEVQQKDYPKEGNPKNRNT